MQRLKDKVCIVTGSGAGIGKTIAKQFASEGAKVICATRRASNGQVTADEICNSGGEAVFVLCDVSIRTSVEAMFDYTIKKYGRIDVLVNNAGVNFDKPFLETEVEDWDRVINVDLRGTFLCTKRAISEMVKNKNKGSIINITSVHTVACLPGASPYAAAKWGVVGMTKALAVEFASIGIRINALSPGLIKTQIWDDIQNAAPDLETCNTYWKSNIPAERVGLPEEVAKAAIFLASEEASYCNGVNLIVDGGMTSQLISKASFESEAIDGGIRE